MRMPKTNFNKKSYAPFIVSNLLVNYKINLHEIPNL